LAVVVVVQIPLLLALAVRAAAHLVLAHMLVFVLVVQVLRAKVITAAER
jgi:hypothetical protein